MLVNLNKKTFLHLHPITVGESAIAGVTLKPGQNRIPSAHMAIYKKHPIVAAMIEAGEIDMDGEVEDHEGKDETKIENSHLISMKAGQAKKAVAETIDIDILNAWLETEKAQAKPRKDVMTAIEKQIHDIQTPGERRSRAEGSHTGQGGQASHADLGEAKVTAED